MTLFKFKTVLFLFFQKKKFELRIKRKSDKFRKKNKIKMEMDMEDPISRPDLIHPYLPHDDQAYVNLFEVAASSFRVAMEIPGATFYIPDKKNILEKEKREKELKEKMKKTPNIPFTPLPPPEQFEEFPPPPGYEELLNQRKAEKEKIIKEEREAQGKNGQQKKPKLVATGLKDEPATYPPPIPNDIDPVRNKMLHAWYWAGYYAGYYDAKKNEQEKGEK